MSQTKTKRRLSFWVILIVACLIIGSAAGYIVGMH